MDERRDSACGSHSELARTTAYRITRCACGMVHLHFARLGVTVQVPADGVAELLNAVSIASRKIEASSANLDSPPNPTVN
jgi:hypothetical protein